MVSLRGEGHPSPEVGEGLPTEKRAAHSAWPPAEAGGRGQVEK